MEASALKWRRIMATVTRIPRMHALPPMTRESRVIRSKSAKFWSLRRCRTRSFQVRLGQTGQRGDRSCSSRHALPLDKFDQPVRCVSLHVEGRDTACLLRSPWWRASQYDFQGIADSTLSSVKSFGHFNQRGRLRASATQPTTKCFPCEVGTLTMS
jgi:hypothetical protein